MSKYPLVRISKELEEDIKMLQKELEEKLSTNISFTKASKAYAARNKRKGFII